MYQTLKITLDLCLCYGLELTGLASYKGRSIYQLDGNSSSINLRVAPKMCSALATGFVVNTWQPRYHSQDEGNVNGIS